MSETGTRERILQATARLLAESGGGPVSTRAVCAAAGVGAPTLYHHFGDKSGLFDAVVNDGFERYLTKKRAQRATDDPVEDMRRGWDAHVEFGLAQPAFYTLMYGGSRRPEAVEEGYKILLGMVEKVARAGRLRVPVENAAQMLHAASIGVTLSLISGDTDDLELSARTRDTLLAALTTDRNETASTASASPSALAVALIAALDDRPAKSLSCPESAMLREWLTRVARE